MDSGTILISLIIFAVCAGFFLSISFAQKARHRKILHDALRTMQLAPNEIGEYTMDGNVILGWLAGGDEFYFYKNGPKGEISSRIRLADIREVKLEKEVKTRSTASGNYSFINSIHLRLYSGSGKADIYLPLYRLDEDAQLGSELQVGQDWASRINSRLNPNRALEMHDLPFGRTKPAL